MNPDFHGSLSIGVTALSQDQVHVVSVSKAKKLPGPSFVISTSYESTILYIGGQVSYFRLLCVHMIHMCVCAHAQCIAHVRAVL